MDWTKTYMRHSTLSPWLQKGQVKTVSSLSIRFLGAGFAFAFLFPIFQPISAQLSFFNSLVHVLGS